MATKQQQQHKQQQIRLPLIGSFTNRDSSALKDQRFVNIFPETRKVESIESTRIFMNKRPGLSLYKTFSSGVGRKICWFRNKYYVVIGNQVLEDGITPTVVITMGTSTGIVGAINGNSSTYGDYLFLCDGIGAWIIKSDGSVVTVSNTLLREISLTSGGTGYTPGTYALGISGGGGSGIVATYTVTGTAVTSIDVTNFGTGYTSAPTISFPSGGGSAASAIAYLNAFPTPHIPTPTSIDGYILLSQNSDVYNCVLDEPDHWDSSNYLTSEIFPDTVVALARQNNQVVVFGVNSTEFFYDAANVSGSPLSRNESTILQTGCAFPYAVYQNEKTCIFIGQSDSGGRAVWQLEGFQGRKISDEFIDRIIDTETSPLLCQGFGLRTMGHLFFIMHLHDLNRTLVYDTDEKLWHEWSTNNGGSHVKFEYSNMVDSGIGKVTMLNNGTGQAVYLDPTSYSDLGEAIPVEIVTNKYDMDTLNRKFMSCVYIVGDRYASGNSINISYTDDDYLNWSTPYTIDLTDDYPVTTPMGCFRRRAFKLQHSLICPLRLESLEVVYTEGKY